MPVSPDAAAAVGMPASRIAFLAAGRSLTHRLLRPDTKLWWLGDVVYLPRPIAQSPLFSVGDIILAAGLFLLVQNAMAGGPSRSRVRPGASPVRRAQHVAELDLSPAQGTANDGTAAPERPPAQVDTPGPGC
jgi:hypothetical protein